MNVSPNKVFTYQQLQKTPDRIRYIYNVPSLQLPNKVLVNVENQSFREEQQSMYVKQIQSPKIQRYEDPEVAKLKQQFSIMKHELQELSRENDQLKVTKQSIMTPQRNNQNETAFKNEIEQLRYELQKKEKEIKRLEEKLRQEQEKKNQINVQIQKKEDQSSQIKEQIETQEEINRQLELRLSQRKNEVGIKIKQEQQANQTTISQIQSELNEKNRTIEQLQQRLTQASRNSQQVQEINNLRLHMKDLQAECDNLRQLNNKDEMNYQKQISNLQQQIDLLRSNKSSFDEQKDFFNKESSTLTSYYNEIQDENKMLKEENFELNQNFPNLQSQINLNSNEIIQLQEQIKMYKNISLRNQKETKQLTPQEIEQLADDFLYGKSDDIQLHSLKELNKLIKYFKQKHLLTVNQLNSLKSPGLNPIIQMDIDEIKNFKAIASYPSRQSSQGSQQEQKSLSELRQQLEQQEKKSQEIFEKIEQGKLYLENQNGDQFISNPNNKKIMQELDQLYLIYESLQKDNYNIKTQIQQIEVSINSKYLQSQQKQNNESIKKIKFSFDELYQSNQNEF